MKIVGFILAGIGVVLAVNPAIGQRLTSQLTPDATLRVCGLLLALLGVLLVAAGRKRSEIHFSSTQVGYPAQAGDEPAPVLSEELSREVVSLLAREGKLGAIKLVRDRTGLGLKQAKEAVEKLERQAGPEPR